jgi:hypothetical protein
MTERILGPAEARAIGRILDAADRHAKVARLTENSLDLEPTYGTARALVRDSEHAYFLTERDDVRNAYLWVTTTSGFEAFWPVAELVDDLRVSTLVLDYDPPKGARA